jgi:AraC-like DNA-binding protein
MTGSGIPPMIRRHFLTFTDPDDYAERLRGSDERIVISARGAYRAELAHLDLGDLFLQRSWQNLPRVVTGGAPPNLTSIVMPSNGDQPEVRFNGIDVGERSLAVLGAGAEYHARVVGELRWGAVTMPTGLLMAAAGALLGQEVGPVAATRLVTPEADTLRRMKAIHETAINLSAATEGDLHAEVATSLKHALVESMVACLADDRAHDRPIPLDGRSVRVVRRFLEVAAARPVQPRYMLEVCREVGVPGRTLRQYCLGHLGMSPHRYLWLRRMNMARRALAAADRDTVTVARIANEFGFAELGRFSVSYRQLFSEVPVATLRRSGRAEGAWTGSRAA